MDLRSLRAFLAVASELNFRKAAERLHMSQPPLTRLISGLEGDLRVKLFERNTVSVSLTPAGRLLVRDARMLIDRADEVEKRVRKLGALPAFALRAGISNIGFMTRVPALIEHFKSSHPRIGVAISTGPADRLLQDLRLGRLDLVCTETADGDDKGLDRWLIDEAPVGVLLPRGHRLAKRKRLKLKDLDGETFVVHPRHEHAHVYEHQRRRLQEVGIDYKIYTKKPAENCGILVARGAGISLTTLTSVQPRSTHAIFVPLEEPGFCIRIAVFSREGERSRELARLLKILRPGRTS